MGFFDSINPFKKKADSGLPPLDQNSGLADPPINDNLNPNMGDGLGNNIPGGHPTMAPLGSSDPLSHPPSGMSSPSEPQPLDDHRMKMPLGESVRQSGLDSMNNVHNPPPTPHPQAHDPNPLQKDMEILSSKLDYLKASLESINQRLANLEHLARKEQDKPKW